MTNKEQKVVVYAAFYVRKKSSFKTDGEASAHQIECFVSDWYLSKFAISHVEFVIENEFDSKQYWSYGINQFDDVIHRIPNKTWSNPKYETPIVIGFRLNFENYNKAITWVDNAKDRGDGFNQNFWKRFLPCAHCCFCCSCLGNRSYGRRLWYCSQLVAKIMSKANLIQASEYSPKYITPQQLYDLVKNRGTEIPITNVSSDIKYD